MPGPRPRKAPRTGVDEGLDDGFPRQGKENGQVVQAVRSPGGDVGRTMDEGRAAGTGAIIVCDAAPMFRSTSYLVARRRWRG